MSLMNCDNLECGLNDGKGRCFIFMFGNINEKECPDYISYENISGGNSDERQSDSMRTLY
jgi:N-methylhydantoinase B/oxoprolinase/acetone carboxylase alpha subunit